MASRRRVLSVLHWVRLLDYLHWPGVWHFSSAPDLLARLLAPARDFEAASEETRSQARHT